MSIKTTAELTRSQRLQRGKGTRHLNNKDLEQLLAIFFISEGLPPNIPPTIVWKRDFHLLPSVCKHVVDMNYPQEKSALRAAFIVSSYSAQRFYHDFLLKFPHHMEWIWGTRVTFTTLRPTLESSQKEPNGWLWTRSQKLCSFILFLGKTRPLQKQLHGHQVFFRVSDVLHPAVMLHWPSGRATVSHKYLHDLFRFVLNIFEGKDALQVENTRDHCNPIINNCSQLGEQLLRDRSYSPFVEKPAADDSPSQQYLQVDPGSVMCVTGRVYWMDAGFVCITWAKVALTWLSSSDVFILISKQGIDSLGGLNEFNNQNV